MVLHKKAHDTFKSTQNGHGCGNQSVKAGCDFVVVLYYFLGQIICCLLTALTFALQSTKKSRGPVHWLLSHSTHSIIAASTRMKKILWGLLTQEGGVGRRVSRAGLVLSPLESDTSEAGISLMPWGPECSLAWHGLFLTVPEESGVDYERWRAREGQTQIPIVL